MSQRGPKKSSKAGTQGLTEWTGGQAEGQEAEFIEFDPTNRQSSLQPQIELQAADLTGTERPGEDVKAAKEELKQRMGDILSQPITAFSAGESDLTGPANIVGFALGEKVTANRFTGQIGVQVYVVQKVPR